MAVIERGRLVAGFCVLSAICFHSAIVAWHARDMPHLHDDGVQPWQTKYPPRYPWIAENTPSGFRFIAFLLGSLADGSVFEPVHSSSGVQIYRIHSGLPSLHASN